jgi:signal transduction histidine kinase
VVERARERHPAATIECSIAAEPVVRADEHLVLVVENLIANAIEHNDAANPTVAVWVTAAAKRATLSVTDDGPGIPSDQRASLLEWEDAGSGPVGNLGVGLAIVRPLADRYGGSVDRLPVEPTGTGAVVSLPRGD